MQVKPDGQEALLVQFFAQYEPDCAKGWQNKSPEQSRSEVQKPPMGVEPG